METERNGRVALRAACLLARPLQETPHVLLQDPSVQKPLHLRQRHPAASTPHVSLLSFREQKRGRLKAIAQCKCKNSFFWWSFFFPGRVCRVLGSVGGRAHMIFFSILGGSSMLRTSFLRRRSMSGWSKACADDISSASATCQRVSPHVIVPLHRARVL